MKSFYIYLLAGAILLSALPIACGSKNISTSPTSYPTATPTPTPNGTPTPTPTPIPAAAVTISTYFASGYHYSPSSVTITHGQSILWDASNGIHPLNIDNGTGVCQVSGQSTFPYTYTFPTAGFYDFHCGAHSTCGNGSCPNPSTCSGMAGTITVN